MKFLQNTYGFDLLSIFLLIISSILNLWYVTKFLGYLLLIYAIYRAFSKNFYRRRQEYNIFYTYINKFLNRFGKSLPYNLPILNLSNLNLLFNKIKNWYNQKKYFKITICPNCKQKLRLPRGKGKILVTCRKCSTKFDFRT
jgi:hypothetical protein